MKKAVFLFVVLVCGALCGAQSYNPVTSPSAVDLLAQAEIQYETGNFGKALTLADEANTTRRLESQWRVEALQNVLRHPSIRRSGNGISGITAILKKQNFSRDALDIINQDVEYLGLDYFDNEYVNLIDYESKRSVYPEALYLMGKLYRLEGDADLALQYFTRSYENAWLLDVKDVKFDIMYDMADLYHRKQDYADYEKILLLIVDTDPTSQDKAYLKAIQKTIHSKKTDSMETFFRMYHSEADQAMYAYFLLAELFTFQNRQNDCLNMVALGTLTAFSHLTQFVSERNIEYSYSDLSHFFDEVDSYEETVYWGNQFGVWKGFNRLALTAESLGAQQFSSALFSVLAEKSPDSVCRNQAAQHISASQ